MTQVINPSPSQFPEVNRQPRSRIHLSVCFQNWILFLIGWLVRVTFLTFDLATDWLLWRVLSSLWIYDSDVGDDVGDGGHALPALFLAFVSMATAIYAGHVIYAAAQFWLFRIRYRSKLDGVPPKFEALQIYGSDLLIGGKLALQSLPLAAILFHLQINVGCDFYFRFYDEVTVMMSLASTCADALCQGCHTLCGWRGLACRREGRASGAHALCVIRCMNCALLCAVFCLVALNFLLIGPIRTALPQGHLASKLCLDRWVDSDYVAFTIAVDDYARTGNDDDVGGNAFFSYNGTDYVGYEHVIGLKPIYERGHADVLLSFDDNHTDLLSAVSLISGYRNPHHCTAVFSFSVPLTGGHIEYNAGYSCWTNKGSGCTLRSLHPTVFGTFANRTSLVRLPLRNDDEPAGSDFGIPPNITLDASNIPIIVTSPPSGIKVFRPNVILSWKMEQKEAPCDRKFVQNKALPLPINIC